MNFRYDINGLRAIAVIAVVLFHFNPAWVPGGFAGVDVFFVISGFLMTSIIFRGLEDDNFKLFKFYVARANRIIPALAVLCLTLLVFGWFYLTPLDYKALGKHVASSMGFLSNVIYWRESGYFDAASHEKWLLHTWSLSVEWQFYIIYPIVLIVLKKFLSLENLKRLIVVGTVLGFAFSVVATMKWPSAAYYLLPTRAWEMMMGGIAFLYPWSLSGSKKKLIEIIGLALILSSYAFVSSDVPWPGHFALLPVLGAYLMITSNQQSSFITNNTLSQCLGKWSYSIYLWHWPIVVYGYYFDVQGWVLYGLPLSIILGFVSFKFIEGLKFKSFSRWLELLKVKPIYMVLVVSISGVFVTKVINGENSWLESQDEITKATYKVLTDSSPKLGAWGADSNGKQDFSLCRFNVDFITDEVASRFNKCHEKFGDGILILGDSHAKDLFGMVSSRFDNDFLVGVTSTQGCRPHTPKDICPYDGVADFVSEFRVFNHIIYEQAGFYLMLDGQRKGSRNMFSKLPINDEILDVHLDFGHIDRVVRYLDRLSKFTNVTWFGSRFEPHITDAMVMKHKCDYPYEFRPGLKEMFSRLDESIKSKVNQTGVNFLSQNETLDYNFPSDFMSCENTLWDDGDHLSAYGEEVLGERLPDDFLMFN